MRTLTMRTLGKLALVVLVSTAASDLKAQDFSCGSTGADGAIDVTQGTVTLGLPPDGVFHATTINVAAGATLTFDPNVLNTPAFLLATDDVTIDGTIAVNGSAGTSTPPVAGKAGPGGFDGGAPGIAELPPGAGQGPGGGLGGISTCCFAGSTAGGGSYGGRGGQSGPRHGEPYGRPVLIPLVGGSGGGGTSGSPGGAGGGGGGAVLLCSDTNITVTGRIEAEGGQGGGGGNAPNGGSGGAIRIVAPRVTGNGVLWVQGGCDSENVCGGLRAGRGRIRIDAIDRTQLNLQALPNGALSVGSAMLAFLEVQPRLDLIEVAGQLIQEGTQQPVAILLPAGSPATQTVRVQATDFTGNVPLDVVLSPVNGDPIIVPAEIDMAGSTTAEVTVQVDFPLNVVTHVHAWTR